MRDILRKIKLSIILSIKFSIGFIKFIFRNLRNFVIKNFLKRWTLVRIFFFLIRWVTLLSPMWFVIVFFLIFLDFCVRLFYLIKQIWYGRKAKYQIHRYLDWLRYFSEFKQYYLLKNLVLYYLVKAFVRLDLFILRQLKRIVYFVEMFPANYEKWSRRFWRYRLYVWFFFSRRFRWKIRYQIRFGNVKISQLSGLIRLRFFFFKFRKFKLLKFEGKKLILKFKNKLLNFKLFFVRIYVRFRVIYVFLFYWFLYFIIFNFCTDCGFTFQYYLKLFNYILRIKI